MMAELLDDYNQLLKGKMRKLNYYLSWVFIFQLIGFGLGQISKANLEWYDSIAKSSFTPPNLAFPIVWSLLYILLALLGAFLWSNRKVPVLSHLLIFYFSQLLFNWLWTPVFFGLHLTYWSLLIIIIIFFITMYIILKSWCNHRLIAYILIPYIVWVSFAGYLNLIICKAYI